MSRIKTAVILAAGMGSRLSDITNDQIPKGLLSINGKTLIERSIEKLRSIGIEKIYIVTGHLSFKYDELANKYKFIKTKKNRKFLVEQLTEASEQEYQATLKKIDKKVAEIYGLGKRALKLISL